MTPSFSLSLRAYERLLIFYPEDLRRDYGAEIVEAFAEDLGAARGIGGVIRVWRSALRELMRIAVPAWFGSPALTVPLLSAALVAASQAPLVVMAVSRHLLIPEALIAVGIESAIAAITSFVVTYRWKRTGLIALRIG